MQGRTKGETNSHLEEVLADLLVDLLGYDLRREMICRWIFSEMICR
jgi:hypothetical protein